VRLRFGALSILAATIPFTMPATALAAGSGPDMALVSLRASVSQAHTGQLVTFKAVAVKNGHGVNGPFVYTTDVPGLTLVDETCAFGVSPDSPACEYSNPKAGKPFTTTFVARAGAPTKHHPTATLTVCAKNDGSTGAPDPDPANDCRSITIKLLGRR
jgi:hypothetical protein